MGSLMFAGHPRCDIVRVGPVVYSVELDTDAQVSAAYAICDNCGALTLPPDDGIVYGFDADDVWIWPGELHPHRCAA